MKALSAALPFTCWLIPATLCACSHITHLSSLNARATLNLRRRVLIACGELYHTIH